jgi:putative peptide zinc metalloprotease protein
MISTPPKLRSDLDRRVQITPNGSVLVIKDPVSGEFFRLQAAEYFIADQLDGATPLNVLNTRVEKEFGASLAPEKLAAFIKTLDRNGLLENQTNGHKPRPKQPERFAGGALALRFKIFDPDRLLNRLLPWVQFCFTPQFLFLSAALICCAAAVTVFNWNEFLRDASRLYSVSTLPLLMATIFLVITAHEFAHGLTCKHFGGEVREMGFMLIYFQPAFYCNVSDAWFFSKARRLWVSFAGPYFEVFLWALATLTWRLTDPETWVSRVALVVMATSGTKTFFNFNPLIKLDGYYLLSDYLEVANLRKKSFRYLGDFLKSFGGLARALPKVTLREKRIFLIYGLIAWVFSFSLFGYMALVIGEHLILEGQRLAFLAFAGLVGIRFRSKFRYLFYRSSEQSRSPPPKRDGLETKTRDWRPGSEQSSSPPPKRDFSSRRRLVLKLAGAAALVLLLFLVKTELRVAGSVNAFPIHNADVRAEIEGIIEVIYVDEGQRVESGEPIAGIYDRDVRAELQKTEAQVAENQARLKLLEAGARTEQIQLAQTTVARHEEQLKFLQGRLERYRLLNKQQLLSMIDYEESARLVASSASDLAEAKKKLELLQAGSRPEEIEALQATVARLETERHHLQGQLRLMQVVSPASGIVTTPARQLKEMRQQLVHKGDLIAEVHDFKTITAEIEVSEKEIADVRSGQAVALKVRAYPERVFPGKVTDIATTVQGATGSASTSASKTGLGGSGLGNAAKSANAILVTTEIDNGKGLLKPGMTGMAKIYCGQRRIIDLITRRLSRTFRVEFWSWW